MRIVINYTNNKGNQDISLVLQHIMIDQIITTEVSFETSRSSGVWWQHVNKTESKVQLFWNLTNSILPEDVKARVHEKYKKRINEQGQLILHSEKTRSQHKNKALAIQQLKNLITKALIPPKVRKKTTISPEAIEERIKDKKRRWEIIRNRKIDTSFE